VDGSVTGEWKQVLVETIFSRTCIPWRPLMPLMVTWLQPFPLPRLNVHTHTHAHTPPPLSLPACRSKTCMKKLSNRDQRRGRGEREGWERERGGGTITGKMGGRRIGLRERGGGVMYSVLSAPPTHTHTHTIVFSHTTLEHIHPPAQYCGIFQSSYIEIHSGSPSAEEALPRSLETSRYQSHWLQRVTELEPDQC